MGGGLGTTLRGGGGERLASGDAASEGGTHGGTESERSQDNGGVGVVDAVTSRFYGRRATISGGLEERKGSPEPTFGHGELRRAPTLGWRYWCPRIWFQRTL